MLFRKYLTVAAGLTLFCSCCAASSFNRVVSLGDSLLDDPSGMRSPLASEHLAQRLGVPLTQLATGGATSTSLLEAGQHTEAAARFGQGDLAVLWIGGNDFLNSGSSIVAGDTGFLDTLESNTDIVLSTLTGAGMAVLVFNLMDLSQAPALADDPTQQASYRQASQSWRTRLNALSTRYNDVAVVDIFSVFDALVEQPNLFSVDGQPPLSAPSFGETQTCPRCTWFDPIHPSALGQGVIANAAITALNAAFDPAGVRALPLLSGTERASLASASTFVTAAGLWFDPMFDGEGYDVVQTAAGTTLFYYGYSASGERLWLISETKPGRLAIGQTQTFNLNVGIGGDFQTPIPGSELTPWGTVDVRINGCGTGTFTLNGTDGGKTHNVVKLADVIGTGCDRP